MEEGDGIGLDPVGRARQQQTKQLRVVQPVEQRRRQPARALDLVSGRRHIGTDSLGTGDDRPVAGKVGSSRDQIIQASLSTPCIQGYACRTLAADIFSPSASSLSICSIDLPLVSKPMK